MASGALAALEQAVGHKLTNGDIEMLTEFYVENPDQEGASLQVAYDNSVGNLDMSDDETKTAVFAEALEDGQGEE